MFEQVKYSAQQYLHYMIVRGLLQLVVYKLVKVVILTVKPLSTTLMSDTNFKTRDSLVDVIGLGILSPHSLAMTVSLGEPSLTVSES